MGSLFSTGYHHTVLNYPANSLFKKIATLRFLPLQSKTTDGLVTIWQVQNLLDRTHRKGK